MTPLPWLNPERRPRRGRRRYCTRRTFVGFVAVLAVTAALGCGAGWDRPAPLAETPVMSTPSSLPDLPEVPPEARNLARKLHECHDLDKDLIEELELYLYSCRSPFHPSRVDDPKLLAPLFVPALAEAFERTDPALIEERFFSLYPGSPYTEDDLVTALKRLGPTVACLVRSRQAPLRRAVAWALAEMAYPQEELLQYPTDAEAKVAKVASLGPAGAKAAEAVQPLLDDPDELVRALACKALARLRPTREAARLLVQRLDDPSRQVVIEAIRGLGWIDAEAAEMLPSLVRFLAPDRDEFDTLRWITLESLLLVHLGPEWVGHLRPLLKIHWEKLCPKNVMACLDLERLAKILGGLGPAARECIPDMERLLHFSDEVIFPGQKIPIACALLEMDSGHTAARHVLEHFAESADPFNRWCVARELWDVPLALQKQFRPLLEKLAADPDEKTRNEAQDRLHDLVSVR
jgi:hypothetical protein